jgi:NAD(P)-dependent dehydrogenase (short-subunit alcohol dehydrogenase family)
MQNQTILITGSTSGIGKATAQELVKNAAILILPVRNLDKGATLKSELLQTNPSCQIDIYHCDMESLQSVKDCANLIASKYKQIDVLINNAGIMDPDFRLTSDGIESHFQVNVLSQYVFNTILKPLLLASDQGRIINLSSALHTRGKFELEGLNTSPTGKLPGIGLYSNSNLYRNLLTFKLAKELESSTITVNCLHPGVIRTNLGSTSANLLWKIITPIFHLFTKPPSKGAQTPIHIATSDQVGQITGKYWANCKIAEPSQLSLDMDLAQALSDKCQELTGV